MTTIRAVDLSRDVAGGFCAKLLAMNGVETTRVDGFSQKTGSWQPVPLTSRATSGSEEMNWLTEYLHHGKRRRDGALDPGEVETVPDMVATADLVLTSFDGGRYTGPVDEEMLRSLNPTVVHVTTSSFGIEGPYNELSGSSLIDWAAGGYLYITGDPDKEPLSGPANLCGYVCGYTAAIAAEAALARRRWDRSGQHIDVSTMESMLSVHQSTFSRLGAGILRKRTGRYTEVYPLIVQPCLDGYVSIGVVSDEEFDRLAVTMGEPELAANPLFATQAARQANIGSLDPILVRWLADKDAATVVGALQANGIPAAAVASVADVLANPQLDARGFWDVITVSGAIGRSPGNPLRTATPKKGSVALSRGRELTGSHLPLGGDPPVTVLDLTAFWAGPSATRNLADLGARVIRVERPGSRSDAVESSDRAAVIAWLFDRKMNRNKESVVVDLKSADGRDIFLGLVEKSDLLVENFRAGAMASLGLDYPNLSVRNPRIVHVALSGFGGAGPWSRWRSYGPTIEAASSIEDRTRYPGGEPMRLGHTLPDGVGGLVGTLAALVGLRQREETGHGAYFDVSQLEAYCVLGGEALLAASIQGTSADPAGNHDPAMSPHGVYPCEGDDEWIAIAVESDDGWEKLSGVLGQPELGGRAFATVDQRLRQQEHLDQTIGRCTAWWKKHDLATALQGVGVRAFPVMTAADLVVDEQLSFRRYFTETTVDSRTVRLPGSPLHCAPPLVRVSGDPPRFGEHTVSVLRSLLGMPEAEIAELLARGIVFADVNSL